MTEPATQPAQPADEPVTATGPSAAAASAPAPASAPEPGSASAPASTPAADPAAARPNVARGIAFAALTVPAGIAAWVLLWQAGFISAIVAFGVAWLALLLYRFGSRGLVTRAGMWVVVATTVVTLVLAFFAGVAWDMASVLEYEIPAVFFDAEFWWLYRVNLLDNPELWSSYTVDILLSVLFAALGTFSVFRSLAKQTSGTPQLRS
ncbi:hypothetical protein [Agromyces archimandritae]|uniref:Uncharacterized protein n=1 Tax=Agromyces archimandritae TaxID=2781962 RepID=A0A975IPD6_9MICO|nr:hypothetical protein [Agromyces archimandritae]QTX05528.1 hypothetical protein G127AT_04745 [Agromyces archimandritae]